MPLTIIVPNEVGMKDFNSTSNLNFWQILLLNETQNMYTGHGYLEISQVSYYVYQARISHVHMQSFHWCPDRIFFLPIIH